jgi:eukaryotic-like serine/threonine-protein kinase
VSTSGDGPSSGAERWVDDQHRYRFESRIATGGMGEVWRATDTALSRPVAVKVLKSEYADDPSFRSRFETEARHAASLHHPGVASVYDVGESQLLGAADGSAVPRPFLVMELVDGQPLSALLRGGRPLDPEVVRDLMAQAADAIGAAHRAGIVHRDVKPANLLVTPERQVKITDFGIARASDGLGLTGTGQVMGTPQYLSPEQARGTTATPASDVYALGVVAFECLAGHRPFDAESPVATALSHLNDPVPDLPAGVPPALAAVVRRALSKDPAQRYADGDAFAVALRDPSAVAETTFVPVTPAEHTQVMTAVPVVDPTPTPAPVRPELEDRRSPWPIVLLVAGLVAVVVLIVWLVLQGDGNGDEDPGASDPSSSTPTSSAPTTEDTPSETASSEPEPINLDADDYVGRDVDEVSADLRDLGLKVDARPVDNPGDKDADTVKSVSPTSGLTEGASVTVEYYREAEPTSEPPSSTPPPTPSPTPSSTPSATPSGSPTAPSSGDPSSSASPAQGSPSPSGPVPGSAAARPARAVHR